jgi:hypothetical protein
MGRRKSGPLRFKRAVVDPERKLHRLLLDHRVRAAIKAAKAGGRPNEPVSALKIKWTSSTLGELTTWLRAGAPFETLAKLLRDHPTFIWHPAVYCQLTRLWAFPSTEEDAYAANRLESGEDGYDGGRSAALAELHRLIAAWVQGMAGTGWDLKPPGWRLKPPLKRRGRKRTLDEMERDSELLGNYEDVLAKLKTHSIRRGKGEEVSSWSARLQEIIRRVWKDSGICNEWVGYSAQWLASASRGADSPNISRGWRVIPLPESRVQAWAHEAQERAAEGPIRDQLAYKMVGYRWDRRSVQVRAAVQKARTRR